MNQRKASFFISSAFLAVSCLSAHVLLNAQAPPGPIRPSSSAPPDLNAPAKLKAETPKLARKQREPRDFAGSWTLNREESDDPRKKMEDAPGGNSGGGSGRRSGGGYPGGGYPGGGGYPRGGGGGNRGGRGGQNGDNRQRMQEILPANSLTIAQKDAEIDVTDDRGHKQVFYTDGRKLQKSKDTAQLESTAKWDDNRLVSEDKGSNGAKITRTFEVAASGLYFYETVRVEGGRSSSSMYLRYVYDAAPEEKP